MLNSTSSNRNVLVDPADKLHSLTIIPKNQTTTVYKSKLLTILNLSDYQSESNKDQPCNLVPSNNSTFPIAPYWENIPETLLLNAFIGVILFIIFLVCTEIAWRRSGHRSSSIGDQPFNDPSLITMLYGYRDPERWYVVPRYEFLKPDKRHHKHNLDDDRIYVPPKLPLADPIELLVFEDGQDETKSRDESSVSGKGNTIKTFEDDQNRNKLKENVSRFNNISPKIMNKIINKRIGMKTPESKLNQTSKKSPREDETNKKIDDRPSPLGSSFFYPTILTDEQLHASTLSRRLNRFFSYFFTTTDADIIYAKGIDAYEYLLFQRHLILIMFITNLFCLGIVLPIHWFLGENHLLTSEYSTSFQRTTIKNLKESSIFYWAHIISSICISSLCIVIMGSYRDSICSRKGDQLARRTLLIGNIPPEQRKRTKLHEVFRRYFSSCKVEAIQYVYNLSELDLYQQRLDVVIAGREYCRYYKRNYNEDIRVKPTDVNECQYCGGNCRLCSCLYVCCFYWPWESKKLGITFYVGQEMKYREKIRNIVNSMVNSPSEYAFVTFRTHRQARRVMNDLGKLKSEALNDRLNRFLRLSSGSITRSPLESAEKIPEDSAKDLTAKGILESARSNDPLDPKNNPKIRSIRSPILKRIEIENARALQTKSKVIKSKKIFRSGKSSSPKRILNPNGSKSGNEKSLSLNNQMIHQNLGPLSWSVRYAPHPDNVEYDDLLLLGTTSRLTIILWQTLMVIIFIFFTTPAVIMSVLEKWVTSEARSDDQFKNLMLNYATTLVQIITTAVLPALVTLISKQIPYEDTASKNHSIMWKVYLFLVLMIIVMPSVGMSSAQAFISSEINPRCLFPTDNGAYYVNYVISSMFLSTILELLKPVDIISYCFLMSTSRSRADFENARQAVGHEFSVSLNHTGVLLVFSVVMTYAISCPLIAPAGLIYLVIKHAVDHYHLFYTYFTRKVDFRMQVTIDIFVKTAILLMLFQTMIAISINTGTSYFSFMAQIVFFSSLALLIFNCFYDCTSQAMIRKKRKRVEREYCACFYLPLTVDKLLRAEAIPEDCISRKI